MQEIDMAQANGKDNDTPDFSFVRKLSVLHAEHVDGVGGHLLLRDQNLNNLIEL